MLFTYRRTLFSTPPASGQHHTVDCTLKCQGIAGVPRGGIGVWGNLLPCTDEICSERCVECLIVGYGS